MKLSFHPRLVMKLHPFRTIVLVSLVALLGACVTTQPPGATAPKPAVDPAIVEEARRQTELAIKQEITEISRLHAVFWPIARAAAPLCPERAVGSIGALPGSLLFLRENIRPALRRLLGMDERLTFTEVVSNTPMQVAGVQPGDILTHIDGVALPVARESSRTYQEALNKALKESRAVKLTVERKGTANELSVAVEPTCALGALPVAGDQVSAYAVNRSVWVTRGMMRFATDADLAIVVGHEVAHIALGHTVRPAAQANPNIDYSRYDPKDPWRQPPPPSPESPQAKLTPQQRELEADVLGIYLTAASGLPYAEAANFWRRMAAQYPSSIQGSHMRTHPASAERFVELERAIAKLAQTLAAPTTRSIALDLRDGRTTAPILLNKAGAQRVSTISEQYQSTLIAAAPAVSAVVNKPIGPDAPAAPVLAKPTAMKLASTITPDKVPYLDDQGREAYRQFLVRGTPRAFALSANGMWASAWGGTDPTARAVKRCAEKGGTQCQLFAVNNEVVWKGDWPEASGDQ